MSLQEQIEKAIEAVLVNNGYCVRQVAMAPLAKELPVLGLMVNYTGSLQLRFSDKPFINK